MKKYLIIFASLSIFSWISINVYFANSAINSVIFYFPAYVILGHIMYNNIFKRNKAEVTVEVKWKYSLLAILLFMVYGLFFGLDKFGIEKNNLQPLLTLMGYYGPMFFATLLLICEYPIRNGEMAELQTNYTQRQLELLKDKKTSHNSDDIDKKIDELLVQQEMYDKKQRLIEEQMTILEDELSNENVNFFKKAYYRTRRNYRINNINAGELEKNHFSIR